MLADPNDESPANVDAAVSVWFIYTSIVFVYSAEFLLHYFSN